MRYLLHLSLIIFIAALLFGCNKSDKVDPVKTTPPPAVGYTDKIVLNEVEVMGDSVKLSWSVWNNPTFDRYAIIRADSTNGSARFPGGVYSNVIKEIKINNQTAFIDTGFFLTNHTAYQVIGWAANNYFIASNMVKVLRPNLALRTVTPFDALYNSSNKLLYLFEQNGTIYTYNYDTSTLKKVISVGSYIGYPELGVYNGAQELYVPRQDGLVSIYNALTYEKIADINTGLKNSSVVSHNNRLYVKTTASAFQKPLKIYSRATLLLTDAAEVPTGEGRLKAYPQSNLVLEEITMAQSPVNSYIHTFSAGGTFLSTLRNSYRSANHLNPKMFEMFPDGMRFITSTWGQVYGKDQELINTFPDADVYTSYAFDQDKKLIYAGCWGNYIKVFSMTDYSYVKTIKTKAIPFRIFNTGDHILCISMPQFIYQHKSYQFSTPEKIVFERLSK